MNDKKVEKRITLRVDPEVHKKLKLITMVKDISVNEYLNQIIAEKIDDIDPTKLVENL